uniref:Lipid A 4'-phosphatase n=1 Tax=Prevotella sp. GTC17254 TaxID=3236794 RepID=A0AB33ITL6_9BACT
MDFSAINQIDINILHCLNGSDNLLLDHFMQYSTLGYTWIPLYLAIFFLVVKNNETMLQIGITVLGILFGVLLASGTDNLLVKPLIERIRPINDPYVKYTLDILKGVGEKDYSFFSAHAANTFAIATFICSLTRSLSLSIIMFSWAILNSITRLYLGVHYPSDVCTGILWGILAGFLSYRAYHYIYYKYSPKINYISSQYTSTGYGHEDIDAIISVFTMSLVILLILSVI